MANSADQKTILLVSENLAIVEATRSILAKEKDFNLLDKEVSPKNLDSVISETKPDVILLDFEFQKHPFNLLEEMTSHYPMSAVVAVLSEADMVNLERVVLSGARAFIQFPYQDDKLEVTIKRVVQLIERNQARTSQETEEEQTIDTRNTFMVYSPKGGVGTTTIATNLAINLRESINEDVLLIDGKQLFGHVPLYLNLLTGNSITDLIAHVGNLDEQLIHQVTVRHSSGIRVLPSPNLVAEAQGLRPESLYKVLQSIQQVFPNIVIDGGSQLNDNTVTFMDSADKILVVLTPDLAAMKDVRQFIEIAATLSYPSEKLLFVLNKTGRKADVRRNEIEDTLKIKIFGEIPADDDFALSCLNEGIPIMIKKSRHPISRSISKMAKKLVKDIRASKNE
jgi:pilus assembly protein CpaE